MSQRIIYYIFCVYLHVVMVDKFTIRYVRGFFFPYYVWLAIARCSQDHDLNLY